MLRIVQQSASASHSYFSTAQLLLPAPRIAGLLPAWVPSSRPSSTPITVFKPQRESLLDRQRAIWAAQDAEIALFLEGARQRLAAVATEVAREYPPRSAHPFIWEIAP